MPLDSVDMKILAVVFPLSSCSFLAYAHMHSVNMLRERSLNSVRQLPVFDLNLGLTLLALSLPFSTILILSVCVAKTFFTSSIHLLSIGLFLIVTATILCIFNRKLKAKSSQYARLRIKKSQFLAPPNTRCCNDKHN